MNMAAVTFFWLIFASDIFFLSLLTFLGPYALDVSYKQSIAYSFIFQTYLFFLQIYQFIVIIDVFLFIMIIEIFVLYFHISLLSCIFHILCEFKHDPNLAEAFL